MKHTDLATLSDANMATDTSILFTLPLEIRQSIYGFASDRPTGSRLILKEYFEKIDPNIPRLPPITPVAQAQPVTVTGHQEDAAVEATDGDGMEISAEADTSVQEDPDFEEDEDEDEDEEDDEENEEEGEDNEEEEDDDDDDDDDEDDEDDGTDLTAEPASAPSSALRSYGRNTKYRHLLGIIQLNRCPPPLGLLQTCQQINSEAVEYHRNQCVLTVDVNKGFEHFSMFEESMSEMMSKPFSPLEHIRKLRLILTWDSEWLREKSTPPDQDINVDQMYIFGFFFSERLQLMINVVSACPELEKISIEYHDTEDTPASRTFMVEKLMDLHVTIAGKTYTGSDGIEHSAELEVLEHFSTAGAVHAKDSLLALRRTEFDHFLLGGLNMR